jgi:hypothetical protein
MGNNFVSKTWNVHICLTDLASSVLEYQSRHLLMPVGYHKGTFILHVLILPSPEVTTRETV